jgi:hypothetical protein
MAAGQITRLRDCLSGWPLAGPRFGLPSAFKLGIRKAKRRLARSMRGEAA